MRWAIGPQNEGDGSNFYGWSGDAEGFSIPLKPLRVKGGPHTVRRAYGPMWGTDTMSGVDLSVVIFSKSGTTFTFVASQVVGTPPGDAGKGTVDLEASLTFIASEGVDYWIGMALLRPDSAGGSKPAWYSANTDAATGVDFYHMNLDSATFGNTAIPSSFEDTDGVGSDQVTGTWCFGFEIESANGEITHIGSPTLPLGIEVPRPMDEPAMILFENLTVENQGKFVADCRTVDNSGTLSNGTLELDFMDAPKVRLFGNEMLLGRIGPLFFTGTDLIGDDDIATASGDPGWAHAASIVVTDEGVDAALSAGINTMRLESGAANSYTYFRNIDYAAGVHTFEFWCIGAEYTSLVGGPYDTTDGGWIVDTVEVVEGPGSVTNASNRVNVSGLSTTAWTLIRGTTFSLTGSGIGRFYFYPGAASGQSIGDGVIVAAPRIWTGTASGDGWAPLSQAGDTFDILLALAADDGGVDAFVLNKTKGTAGLDQAGTYNYRDLGIRSLAAHISGRGAWLTGDGPRILRMTETGTVSLDDVRVLRGRNVYPAMADSQFGTKSNPTATAQLYRVGLALQDEVDGHVVLASIAGGRMLTNVLTASTAGATRYNGVPGENDIIEMVKKAGATLLPVLGTNDIEYGVSDEATAASVTAALNTAYDTILSDLGNGSAALLGLPVRAGVEADQYEAEATRLLNDYLYQLAVTYDLGFIGTWADSWDGTIVSGVYQFDAAYSSDGLHWNTTGAEDVAAPAYVLSIQRQRSEVGNFPVLPGIYLFDDGAASQLAVQDLPVGDTFSFDVTALGLTAGNYVLGVEVVDQYGGQSDRTLLGVSIGAGGVPTLDFYVPEQVEASALAGGDIRVAWVVDLVDGAGQDEPAEFEVALPTAPTTAAATVAWDPSGVHSVEFSGGPPSGVYYVRSSDGIVSGQRGDWVASNSVTADAVGPPVPDIDETAL